jgi:hypothetical protein
VLFDGGIFCDVNFWNTFFWNTIVRRNQIQPHPLVGIPFDVPAAKNGSYKFDSALALVGGFAVGEDFISLCLADDEGFVEAGFYTVVDGDVPVFERDAGCFNLPLYALFYWVKNNPRTAVGGEIHRGGVLSNKNARFFFGAFEPSPRFNDNRPFPANGLPEETNETL